VPVVLTYFKDADAADAVVGAIAEGGGQAAAIAADVGQEDAVERLFDLAERRFGLVNLLVNSAGLNMTGVMIEDMALAQFDRLIRADLYGPFLTCRRLVRGLASAALSQTLVTAGQRHPVWGSGSIGKMLIEHVHGLGHDRGANAKCSFD
jgi:glucose 1-dehydrogenase